MLSGNYNFDEVNKGNLGLWRTTCSAQDTSDHLKPGDQLNHTNPTICSVGRSYCLQFMKIYSYSSLYYLAVYSGFLESFVWVANRNDQNTNGSSEALTLDHFGVLKITHQGQEPTILYSPPADQPHELINNTKATLLDTGNFVLQQNHPNGSNIVLWQSFDYPTDTLLPGMRLGVNHKTGKKWSLVSYFHQTSPSLGPFTLEWEPKTGQLIILRRGQVYWASGVLRNGKFEYLSDEAQSLYNYTIVSNKNAEYFTFSPRNDATKFDKQSAKWSITPTGELLAGSDVIASAGDCYRFSSNRGCLSLDQPACRHKGEFFDIRYVSLRGQGLAYSTDDNVSLTISDCQAICWSNCHCVGFTSFNDNATGCVFYSENSQMSVPEDKILKLNFLANRSEPMDKGPAQSPSPGQRDQFQDSNASAKRIKLLIYVITPTLFIICAILWILIRRRRSKLEGKKRTKMEDEKGAKETSNDAANLNELQNYKKDGHALKLFSYASIMEATDSFSSNNKLGQGGFGHVYKGKLHDGKEVAIKKLSRSSGQGVTEFKNELTLISELQHRNLVQLLGCCIQGEERILIYEFMPNKSLDFFLFDPTKRKLLDWKTRFNIIEGIVQGLLYLHKYSRVRIVHRDLKASNILLDENMSPKISDFGLARTITQESEGSTQRIVGTYGYMPPEYAMEGIFSIKSDVYSFGILMLEIVSGRRNSSFYTENSSLNLVGHAWELWKDGAALELVDEGIKDSLVQEDQALRCIHVALLCAEERAVDRPTMADILSMLTNQSSKLPSLKRPALCFVNNSSVNTGSSYPLTSLIVTLGIQVTEKKRKGYCDAELPCAESLREAASILPCDP